MKKLNIPEVWAQLSPEELDAWADEMGSAGDTLGIATLRVARGWTLEEILEEWEELPKLLSYSEWQQLAGMTREEAQRDLVSCLPDWHPAWHA